MKIFYRLFCSLIVFAALIPLNAQVVEGKQTVAVLEF